MGKERFINRDVSWLEFNSRVLDEATDEGNPLLERLKFLAIFSSNLDEFFMVRMAGISQQPPDSVQKMYKDYSYIPCVLLTALEKRIRALTAKQYSYFNSVMLPALEKEKIHIVSWNSLTAAERAAARGILEREILPVLTPIGIDPSHPFPLVPNLGLELLVRLRKKDSPAKTPDRFAVLEVPPVVPRFVLLENSANGMKFIPAEELVSCNLELLFSGCEVLECSAFRVTRDMDFSIDEESIDDLLSEMQIALQKKMKRVAVRLEISSGTSAASRKFLQEKLSVTPHQLYSVPGPLNLKSLFQLASIKTCPALIDTPMPPLPPLRVDPGKSMFENIRAQGGFLIHLPYESFDPVIRLLEEAADDPDVLAIKQTLYRVSGNSPVVNALIRAARNGKQVSVLFEIKARFDEENNIRCAQELAEAGAHVVYGIAGLKVHCKALLVVRREETGIHRYAHLGTGNYNDKTAKQYTDLGLFTDDSLIAADVSGLFNVITGFSDPPHWNKLTVAPFDLKNRIIYLIDREAKLSNAQNPGHITIKCNAVIDYEIIEHLYNAARNHVKIDMVIRGICGLDPFSLPPDAAKNIRIVSILDRFLEHSRIYIFQNNGAPEYYMGSADLMPRNLRRRIELLFPIERDDLRAELDFIVRTALNDRRKGRVLTGSNEYTVPARNPAKNIERTRSQYALYEFYKQRLERGKKLSARKKLQVYSAPHKK